MAYFRLRKLNICRRIYMSGNAVFFWAYFQERNWGIFMEYFQLQELLIFMANFQFPELRILIAYFQFQRLRLFVLQSFKCWEGVYILLAYFHLRKWRIFLVYFHFREWRIFWHVFSSWNCAFLSVILWMDMTYFYVPSIFILGSCLQVDPSLHNFNSDLLPLLLPSSNLMRLLLSLSLSW